MFLVFVIACIHFSISAGLSSSQKEMGVCVA